MEVSGLWGIELVRILPGVVPSVVVSAVVVGWVVLLMWILSVWVPCEVLLLVTTES